MAPRLFENRVGWDCIILESYDNNDFTNCNSVVAAVIARYSTSVEEWATVRCFVELHEIGLTPRNIRKAPVGYDHLGYQPSLHQRNHAMFEECLQEAVH